MTRHAPRIRARHWAIATLIALNAGLGLGALAGPRAPGGLASLRWHLAIGLLVLALGLWRWARPPRPDLSARDPKAARVLAKTVHGLLAAIALALPLSGLVLIGSGGWTRLLGVDPGLSTPEMSLGGALGLAALVHGLGPFVLLALALVHGGAALVHKLVWRDGVFDRMWPPLGD